VAFNQANIKVPRLSLLTDLPTYLPERLRLWLRKAGDEWVSLEIGTLLLAILFLAFTWQMTLARIEHEEQQARQNISEDNLNIAAVVKANLEQVISKTAIYADLAAALLDGDRAMAAHLNPTLTGDRAYLRLALFNSAGTLIHSSARRDSEPELAASVAAATQGMRQMPPNRALVLVHPQTTRDAWRVPLLVGIQSGGGNPGVLAAVLDLGYFLQLFQEVHLGKGGRIEIIDSKGYQLVEASGATLSAGKDYQDSDYLRFLQGDAGESNLVLRSGDPSTSIVAFQRLENYPLIVVVSQAYSEVQSQLNLRRENYIRWASFISVLLLVAAFSLIWLQRRQRAIHRELLHSESENRKLIAQLEQEKERAYQLASHDHLTGLPNRNLFTELAESHVLRARRSRRYHAVLFIDLDRFKIINDTLGHRVGDLLLKEVARRFRTCLRESDVVARVGGDEFVMLVNDAETIVDVENMAEKIVGIVSEPFDNLEGHTVEVSPSIGIAVFPRDGEGIDVLLRHADMAMYSAKAAGRGTYRFHDMALNKVALRQLELLQGLRNAVREGDFVLHYQARVTTKDFSVVSLEALVRWQHPEFGLIYPNDFIALAEEHDLIAPLGLWVINAVCQQLADWRRQDVPLVPVAVNISARQLRNGNLAADICDALQRHDLPAQWFEIEITESCLIEAQEQTIETLSALVERGVKIAMDDYGTGFASLGYLKMLPLYAIKIDRSFIREILNDASDAIIVASTTTLAHNLDLVVVAEGVETRAQLIHVKTVGCDQVQGYYFHRPAAAESIEVVLREGRFLK